MIFPPFLTQVGYFKKQLAKTLRGLPNEPSAKTRFPPRIEEKVWNTHIFLCWQSNKDISTAFSYHVGYAKINLQKMQEKINPFYTILKVFEDASNLKSPHEDDPEKEDSTAKKDSNVMFSDIVDAYEGNGNKLPYQNYRIM